MVTNSSGSSASTRQRERIGRRPRTAVKSLLDIGILAAAFGLAYLLRFDFRIPAERMDAFWLTLAVVVTWQFVALWLGGASDVVWRYVSLADLPLFLRAAAYGAIPLVVLRLIPEQLGIAPRIPLSVTFFDTVLALLGVVGLRVIGRAASERHHQARTTSGEVPLLRSKAVILIGAGRAGVLAIREIRGRGDMGIEAVGFVDDDPLKQGSIVGGLKVLGTTADLPKLVPEHQIDHVIITIADADPTRMQRVAHTCERIPVKVRTIPSFYDLVRGDVSINRIRDVNFDDLLGRDTVELDTERLQEFLTDKCVMVTGAGGSIGSELVVQVARFAPRCVVLVERSEPALFEVHRKLAGLWPEIHFVPLIADVGDTARMDSILAEYAPQVLIHAAAHKHVTMMEENPGEAIKNNVLATQNLGGLAAQHRVDVFVLISTDKAVRPTSIMGASKRVAELVIQDLDQQHATRFVAVRFGNVLGSAGSVIPIFDEQIRGGGPVTVTDERMRRYFMSIPEASQLVLSAATLAEGGEIFILDMGEPVSIVALAEKLIRLSGFEPYQDIDIVFTGRRQGEKIREELGNAQEQLAPTANEKIFVATATMAPPERLHNAIAVLDHLISEGQAGDRIRDVLDGLLPESRLTATTGSLPSPHP